MGMDFLYAAFLIIKLLFKGSSRGIKTARIRGANCPFTLPTAVPD